MAQDWIPINANLTTHASQLKSVTQVLRQAYDQLVAIKARMFHNYVQGTPGDAAGIEALYGLDPGDGQAVLDYVNGAVAVFEGSAQSTDLKMLTERVG